MIKNCFICETPFHVLNCLNLSIQLKNNDSNNVVFIREAEYLPESLIDRIKCSQFFDEIYTYKYPIINSKIGNAFLGLKKVMNSEKYFFQLTHIKDIPKDEYSNIFTAVPTNFVFSIILLNPEANLYYYDDGIGSYLDDMRVLPFKNSLLLCEILGKKVNIFDPVAVYLNNPEYSLINSCDNVFKLVNFVEDVRYKTYFYNIFNFVGNEIYNKHFLIYLTMPNDKHIDSFAELSKIVIDTIKETKMDCILRVHPRDETKYSDSFIIDNTRDIWELIASSQITNDHTLVGCFSTAQITPSLIYNKEPYLIFTYKLYKGILDNKFIDGADSIVNILKKKYSCPEKICVVESIEHFSSIIREKSAVTHWR